MADLRCGTRSPVDDLAKYERTETSDDYRHRMTMNLLTLMIAATLIAGGVWLTTKLVENRNLQDCFLRGAATARRSPADQVANLISVRAET